MKTKSERTNCSSDKGENMGTLNERAHQTRCGTIRYWADVVSPDKPEEINRLIENFLISLQPI